MAFDMIMAFPHRLGGCILLRSLPMDWTSLDQAVSIRIDCPMCMQD